MSEQAELLKAAKFFFAIAEQYGHGPKRGDSEYATIWGSHYAAIAAAEHEPASFDWTASGCRVREQVRKFGASCDDDTAEYTGDGPAPGAG